MRPFGLLVTACILALAAGCASFSVNYDYDPQYNFAKLKTYDWIPAPEKAPADEFVVKQVKAAVDKGLKAKGYSLSPQKPDFMIALHGGKEKRVDVQQWGYSYGRYGYYGGPYGAQPYWAPRPYYGYYGGPGQDYYYRTGTDVYEYEIGTLVVDFVDSATKELIWRGTAVGIVDPSLSPVERDRKVNEVITKMLENFPPPATK